MTDHTGPVEFWIDGGAIDDYLAERRAAESPPTSAAAARAALDAARIEAVQAHDAHELARHAFIRAALLEVAPDAAAVSYQLDHFDTPFNVTVTDPDGETSVLTDAQHRALQDQLSGLSLTTPTDGEQHEVEL